jgi:hypothetical protein
MLKKGFELLKKKTTIYDVAKLEQEYGILLPPIFKLFFNYFDICEYFSPPFNEVMGSTHKIATSYVAFKLDKEEILMESYADSVPQLFQQWHYDRFESWSKMGFLQFLVTGGGGICVSTRTEDKDAIFTVTEIGVRKIANNIFEFVDGLEQIKLSEESLRLAGIQLSKLYKNWGEDFWRVRENESE